ncbi:hypothetical protein [Pseudoalteromonas phenolica]|uniref:hypothetical protein n=1 Tax=Pseudoalteromonas phenolica TaxID=161398 RepID=UPI00110BFE53|nr:hypothetical protein [Pseudoalteromonas phenolica]
MNNNKKMDQLMEKLPSPKHLSGFYYSLKTRWLTFWRSLTFAQRLYFTAIVLFFLLLNGESEPVPGVPDDEQFLNDLFSPSTFLMVTIIIIALLSELWPKLMKFWDSLPGKAVVLIFYAFIANYALAYAAGAINDITGVSADHFPYTHNLSLMLSLPSWFFISTLSILLLVPLLQPFYVLLLLFMRPFGLHTMWHPPEYRFPIITSFVRMTLCVMLFVFVLMFTFTSGMFGGMSTMFTNVIESFSNTTVSTNVTEEVDKELADTAKLEKENTEQMEQAITNSEADQSPGLSFNIGESDASSLSLSERTEAYDNKIKTILAYFIYELEADSYSRCQVTEGSRMVELNDYEILEITQLSEQERTYKYEVKPCISVAIGHQFKSSASKPTEEKR